jgi:GntR family transcriptional regulator of arabinose operon
MRVKYQQLAGVLSGKIESGGFGPGDPLPSEVELAQQYGVNRHTLRRALDLLEEEGKVIRRRGRGTFVRPGSAPSQSAMLLYVGENESHFYKDLYCALAREAQKQGLSAVGFMPGQAGKNLADSPQLGQLLSVAAGVICQSNYWQALSSFVPGGVPVVQVTDFFGEPGSAAPSRPTHVVATDMLRAAKLATTYLVSLGHRRIALVCVGANPGPHPLLRMPNPRQQAYQGYVAGMLEGGLAEQTVLGVPYAGERRWEERGHEAVQQFLRMTPELPTAFVCEADFRAGPLIQALRDAGLRAPQDFSVVGIGNTPWCEMLAPPLTSVSMREDEIARLAVMLCRQNGADAPAVVHVAPQLVCRASAGPPRVAS